MDLFPYQIPEKAEKLRHETLEFVRKLDVSSLETFLLRASGKDTHEDEILKHIEAHFVHLEHQLKTQSKLTYLNIMDFGFDDLFAHDASLRLLVKHASAAGLLKKSNDLCMNLIDEYLKVVPNALTDFRRKLSAILVKLDEQKFTSNMPDSSLIDYKMVTYEPVDLVKLSQSLSQMSDPQSQLEHLIESVRFKNSHNLNRFLQVIQNVLNESQLASFGPKVHLFGSQANGLGTYNSDLDIVVQFDFLFKEGLTLLDFETAMMVVRAIRRVMERRLGLKIEDGFIVPSRRCPLIKLDFADASPESVKSQVMALNMNKLSQLLTFNKCDISVRSLYSYYNSQLLHFYTEYDARFYQMTHLLKYWAKRIGLIGAERTATGASTSITSYALTLMVVFFLEKISPPVLPTLDKLQELAAKQGLAPVRIHRYNFEFSTDRELIEAAMGVKNTKSVSELIFEFFQYFHAFDSKESALRLRTGKSMSRMTMSTQNRALLTDVNFAFRTSNIIIEDPFVPESNVGSCFSSDANVKWRQTVGNLTSSKVGMTPTNCVKLLLQEKKQSNNKGKKFYRR